jgi:beta-N-acetylhexosaminidase
MNLTLEQKIGQLMIIGWQSEKYQDIVELLEKYHFGNVILFTRNIKSFSQIKTAIEKIQEAALKYNGVPAFISVDQEGGNIRRIYEDITHIPGHMAIGAASNFDQNAAYKIGKIVGQELKHLGVNCNFAPVADVNSNQKNPIIGIRAFSDDPEVVSNLASEYAKGLDEHKVIATYKHFIGHGNVTIDSHLDLPHLNTSYQDLEKCELVPYMNPHFKPAAIMTAHILYNQIDDRFPATLSRKIIHETLREKMNFKGLVIGDCLEMDAISRAFALEEAGVFALKATVDLVLVSHTFGRQMKVRNGIIKAVKEGEISLQELDERVENVLRHKNIYAKTLTEETVDFKKNAQIAKEISLNSVTLAHGEPFPLDENAVVIGVTNYLSSTAEDKNIENMDIAKIIGEEFNIPYRSIDN